VLRSSVPFLLVPISCAQQAPAPCAPSQLNTGSGSNSISAGPRGQPAPSPSVPGKLDSGSGSNSISAATQGLEIKIENEQSSRFGENAIRMTLRNKGIPLLWVNYQLGFCVQASTPCNVRLEIVHALDGRNLETNCRVKRQEPSRDSYVVLGHRAEISVVRSLGCFPFPDTGPWRIVARYKDTNPPEEAPPYGAKWFSGEAVSEALELNAVVRKNSSEIHAPDGSTNAGAHGP
jgi:hypothetical protein